SAAFELQRVANFGSDNQRDNLKQGQTDPQAHDVVAIDSIGEDIANPGPAGRFRAAAQIVHESGALRLGHVQPDTLRRLLPGRVFEVHIDAECDFEDDNSD
ncbi:hypothetical protein BVRB_028280, partial [Beta vulgaris subsp. vulgaris]